MSMLGHVVISSTCEYVPYDLTDVGPCPIDAFNNVGVRALPF